MCILDSGYAGINLISIDPLQIPEIQLNQGAESPVNIKLKFSNVSMHGIQKFECSKVVGWQENPEGKYELNFKGPVLSLLGPYSISGKVLLLPIQGVGDSNITLGRSYGKCKCIFLICFTDRRNLHFQWNL